MSTVDQAREWLIDCFPDEEDIINDATDAAILRRTNRLYDGGLAGFEHSIGL